MPSSVDLRLCHHVGFLIFPRKGPLPPLLLKFKTPWRGLRDEIYEPSFPPSVHHPFPWGFDPGLPGPLIFIRSTLRNTDNTWYTNYSMSWERHSHPLLPTTSLKVTGQGRWGSTRPPGKPAWSNANSFWARLRGSRQDEAGGVSRRAGPRTGKRPDGVAGFHGRRSQLVKSRFLGEGQRVPNNRKWDFQPMMRFTWQLWGIGGWQRHTVGQDLDPTFLKGIRCLEERKWP